MALDVSNEPVIAGVGVGMLASLVVDGLLVWGVDLTAPQQNWLTRTLLVVGGIGGAVWGRRKVASPATVAAMTTPPEPAPEG